jgi:septum formation protein
MEQERTGPNVALHLAKLKAESVLNDSIDGLVIGGDSVFDCAGTLYGKPYEPAVAKARWQEMRGNTGTLYSGLWVIDHTGGTQHGAMGHVSHATLHFSHTMSDEEIDAYVATGEPLNVAGAFTLDGLGAAFIDNVEGDPYAVVGMSASALRNLILNLGHSYHQFWA